MNLLQGCQAVALIGSSIKKGLQLQA